MSCLQKARISMATTPPQVLERGRMKGPSLTGQLGGALPSHLEAGSIPMWGGGKQVRSLSPGSRPFTNLNQSAVSVPV